MEDVKYYLKKPDAKRKRYVLVCYKALSRTKKAYLPLSEVIAEAVEAINKKYLQKIITQHETETLFKELMAVQYRKSKVQSTVLKNTVLSETNLKVFKKFWAEKYEVKYLEDESSARYDFERAFKAIETLAILTASETEIQKLLKQRLSANQIRRVVDRLNELLKFLQRGLQLKKPKKARVKITHVNEADFLTVHSAIECHECKALAMTLFASGVRLGEAMALEPEDFYNGQLSVTKQKTAYGTKKVKAPKREKEGDVAVLELGLKEIKLWLSIEDKWAHRWHFGVRAFDWSLTTYS